MKWYGATPKPCSVMNRTYRDLEVLLKIGKTKETMSQRVGFCQGECMASLLLLFMVMAFAESLEREWFKAGLDMIHMRQHTHSPADIEKLSNQKASKYL